MTSKTMFLTSLAFIFLIAAMPLNAMPPLYGGPEPDYSPGVNEPGRMAPARDEADLEGEWNLLVILIDFEDYPWDNQEDTLFNNEGNPYTVVHFNAMLFSDDEFAHPGSESDYTGSMRDYYNEVSGDDFTVTGVVTQWYRASEEYAFYVGFDHGTGAYPNNSQRLVEEAIELADDDVDFSDFDNNDDDIVDALVVVHASPGAEEIRDEELRANYIWSHKWQIDMQQRDGVFISEFNMDPETGTIGVFCHEFGHSLGLPDLYDIDYSSQGIGEWGLMGGGGWCARAGDPLGSSPVHFCGWSKLQLGWVEVINVTEPMENVEIPPVETDGIVYRLWTDGDEESPEFFLLENRRRIGFDEGLTRRQYAMDLPAPEGLLITHIDDRIAGGGNNDNANDEHRRVDIEEASVVWIDEEAFEQLDGPREDGPFENLYNHNRGDNGDLWPGYSEVSEDSTDWEGDRDRDRFGIMTVPSSINYDGMPSLVEIYDTRLEGENVVASFAISAPDCPILYVADWAVNDEDGGNGNGFIEPGETIALSVRLGNVGLQEAMAVSAQLTYESDLVEVTRGEVNYPDIFNDQEHDPENPFLFRVSEDAPQFGTLRFMLTVLYNDEFEQSQPFNIEMNPPHEWFKYPDNPVLIGNNDAWDGGILSPAVIVEGDTLKCWYIGINDRIEPVNPGAVGYAWSLDGGMNWERREEPVLVPEGDEMSMGIGGIGVMPIGEGYLMAFVTSGNVDNDTTSSISLAVSEDGIEWEIIGDPIVENNQAWITDLIGGQLALFSPDFDLIICAFSALSQMGLPVIGSVSTIDFEEWELSEPIISPTMDMNDFDAFAVLAPDVIIGEEYATILYTGFTMDFIGRLGVVTSQDGENFERHLGMETGGSVLEPGGDGGWVGEEMLFGGRLFDWHGERRMLFTGVTGLQDAAAVGLALPSPVMSVPPEWKSDAAVPHTVLLYPAYPNPFNSATNIMYRLAHPGLVQVSIYDLSGREVIGLYEGSQQTGSYRLQWDGLNNRSLPVAGGIYFVRVKSDGRVQSSRLLLVK